MEKEIEDAFGCLTAGGLVDPLVRRKALEFYDSLTRTASALQPVLRLFHATKSWECKFYCLQVLETQVQNQLHSPAFLRDLALGMLIPELTRTAEEMTGVPFYCRNKLATILVKILKATYLSVWDTAIQDVVRLLVQDDKFKLERAGLFLLVCEAVDEEIVNLAINRSDQEISLNSQLKDKMREGDVALLFATWLCLMEQFIGAGEVSRLELLLKVVARFSSWIDAAFLREPRFIQMLRQIFSLGPQVRIAAIDCFCTIICKGMAPENKISLLELYGTFELVPVLFDYLFTQSSASKVEQLSFCKLLNSVGIEMVCCCNEDPLGSSEILGKIEYLFTFLVQLFESLRDPELLIELCGFLTDFIDLLKTLMKRSTGQMSMTLSTLGERILPAVVRNLGYPEEFEFDEEPDDIESWFLEFRNILTLALINLYHVLGDFEINYISEYLQKAFDSQDNLEVAIYLLFLYAEITKCIPERVYRGDFPADLDRLIVTSIAQIPSNLFMKFSGKYLIFFETVARYAQYGFFNKHPDLLWKSVEYIFTAFESNSSTFVRAKLANLMAKLVKFQRSTFDSDKKLSQYFVARLIPFLGIVPTEHEEEFVFIAQLYECVGVLLMNCENNALMLQQIIDSVYRQSSIYATQPSFFINSFTAIGNVAKGLPEFSPTNQAMQAIYSILVGFGEFSLKVLTQFVDNPSVRSGTMFLMQRLFLAIGTYSIAFLSSLVSSTLEKGNLSDFSELLSLLSSFVHKYPLQIADSSSSFVNILLLKLFDVFSHFKPEGTDDKTSFVGLKRDFLSFCVTLLSANKGMQLLSPVSLPTSTFHSLLSLILALGQDSTDPSVQKPAFHLMSKSVTVWMPSIGASNPEEIAGFDGFVFSQYFPSALNVLRSPNFDFSDTQCSSVAGEICSLFKNAHKKNPTQTVACLNQLLTMVGINHSSAQLFIKQLETSEPKQFKKTCLEVFQSLHRS